MLLLAYASPRGVLHLPRRSEGAQKDSQQCCLSTLLFMKLDSGVRAQPA